MLHKLLLLFALASALRAAAADDGIEFFEKKIRPVLAAECYRCHSREAEKQERQERNPSDPQGQRPRPNRAGTLSR